MAVDILGCVKSALKQGPDRSIHFTPYGQAGGTYELRSHLDAEKVGRGVSAFCSTGLFLAAAFLAAYVFKVTAVIVLGLIAVAGWLVAYAIWTRGVVRTLPRVSDDAR